MTAHALEKDRYACLEAGMDDFLAKPIDVEHLKEIIQRWTERKHQ
jgi:CheY-like chemotaxis protein